tara:strand:+ start:3038 stop:4135 length:1098 start_codon:yes stop_codon:yes gene_type:complete
MIIDAHVYCFHPADHPAGHTTPEQHLAWLQVAVAGHHQPVVRLSDRTESDTSALAPAGRERINDLPDLKFRPDHERGRLVWTIDGEDYTKYWMPPDLRNLEFTPHSLIGEMDYAGVDVALLHTDPSLGRDSTFLARCVASYPDRLRAMAPVDEWRITGEPDAVIAELTESIETHGLHAIKFIPDTAYLDLGTAWDDGAYRPFWEVATSFGLPVFFTLGSGGSDNEIEGYLDQQRILMRWMERYPDTPCVLTHGFPYRSMREGRRIAVPNEAWTPFGNPNCHLEVCLPVRLGDWFDYPYRELHSTLEEMVERVGPNQLMWGTDMPFQNRFCTYRQSRDWIEKHCAFLDETSRLAIMGGTAARILDL